MITVHDETARLSHAGGAVYDLAHLPSSALELIGERMGFYRELAMLGSMTPDELARMTGAGEQYTRDWLTRQAAAGNIAYSPKSGRFSLRLKQEDAVRRRYRLAR